MNQLQSENINELFSALSKAQGEITAATKDNMNPHFKSKYADLSSIWNACRAQLSKHGLAVLQSINHLENGQMVLVTTLGHSSGQWMRSYTPILLQRQDAQGLGSALTYMRRYSLAAMVGVAPDDDDDGEIAVGRPLQAKKPEKPDLISKDKIDKIEGLIGNDMEYKSKILSFFQIKTFSELQSKDFDRVLKRVQEFIEAKKKSDELPQAMEA